MMKLLNVFLLGIQDPELDIKVIVWISKNEHQIVT